MAWKGLKDIPWPMLRKAAIYCNYCPIPLVFMTRKQILIVEICLLCYPTRFALIAHFKSSRF
jgi:hypothetical protein